jgi:hypothetical protein
MRSFAWDLRCNLGYAVAACAAVNAFGPQLPWGLLAAPLALLAPGWALARGLGLGGPDDSLTLAVSAITLSFATLVLGGLAVTLLGVSLTVRSWSVLLLAVTAGGSGVALTGCRAFPRPRAPAWPTIRRRMTPLLLCAGALALVSLAAVKARSSEARLDTRSATPHLSAIRSGDEVRVAVSNPTAERVSYRVSMATGGRIVDRQLVLRPGATWRTTLLLGSDTEQSATIALYRAKSAAPSAFTVVR